jgi:ubiquinone/menaquinone biosynthesis C-methylase UbiE
MRTLQREPTLLSELRESYDRLYQSWLGQHRNLDQTERILKLLDVRPGTRLLDIACGLGYLADQAVKRGLVASGIDISAVALRRARQEFPQVDCFVLGDAERLPWPDGYFDYAVNLGSLEHFINPGQAVREMVRVLHPTGRAAVLVPNSHHIRAIYNVYKFGEILPDEQDFERFATRLEWERLLCANGLHVLSVHKHDTGMARIHKPGRVVFWYLYNIFFRLMGDLIPLNLAYTFIFICQPKTRV